MVALRRKRGAVEPKDATLMQAAAVVVAVQAGKKRNTPVCWYCSAVYKPQSVKINRQPSTTAGLIATLVQFIAQAKLRCVEPAKFEISELVLRCLIFMRRCRAPTASFNGCYELAQLPALCFTCRRTAKPAVSSATNDRLGGLAKTKACASSFEPKYRASRTEPETVAADPKQQATAARQSATGTLTSEKGRASSAESQKDAAGGRGDRRRTTERARRKGRANERKVRGPLASRRRTGNAHQGWQAVRKRKASPNRQRARAARRKEERRR